MDIPDSLRNESAEKQIWGRKDKVFRTEPEGNPALIWRTDLVSGSVTQDNDCQVDIFKNTKATLYRMAFVYIIMCVISVEGPVSVWKRSAFHRHPGSQQ